MSKLNRSKTYMFPLLADFIKIDQASLSFLRNTYLNVKDKYSEVIVLEYEYPINKPDFIKYENELMNTDLFIEHYDRDGKVYYVFKFPEVYLEDYHHFIRSEYSKIKNSSKLIIITYWTKLQMQKCVSLNFILQIKKILYKSQELRKAYEKDLNVVISPDQELGEYIEIQDETLNLDVN